MAVGTTGTLLAGRYRVIDRLGAGGAATVLLADDERLGRQVAVKRLHAYGPEEMAERFEREARLGASLNHNNLVSVFDVTADEEDVLIVMEYVEGSPLSAEIRRGPFQPARVVDVVCQTAAALDHAHSHGVVHRDVKPANVLLRHDGVVKLVDLGIATAYEATGITGSGTILGTAPYMAPEQLDGERAGPAADIYALAAVAYEMLTGQKANQGATPVEIARRATEEPPPDLRDAMPDAPEAAAEILRRGLARDPGGRPLSAGRFAADLKQAFATRAKRGLPAASAAPPTASTEHLHERPPRTQRAQRSRRTPVLVALALAVLLAVIAIASLGGGDDGAESGNAGGGDEPEKAAKQPSKFEQPESQAPAAGAGGSGGSSGGSTAATGSGAELNSQGHRLMRQGRFDEAIPILRRAVAAFPEGTSDLNYAYALFNLGSALRQAGRPAEAIPILEQRLEIPNQTETVRRELEAARAAAGQGGDGEDDGDEGNGKAKGKGKKGD